MSEQFTVVTEQVPIPIEIVAPGNRPKCRLFRTVKIMVSGAYLVNAGITYLNLGQIAVPLALSASAPGDTYCIDLYDNVMPIQIDQCELSLPLAGGSVTVFLAAFL